MSAKIKIQKIHTTIIQKNAKLLKRGSYKHTYDSIFSSIFEFKVQNQNKKFIHQKSRKITKSKFLLKGVITNIYMIQSYSKLSNSKYKIKIKNPYKSNSECKIDFFFFCKYLRVIESSSECFEYNCSS